MNVVTRGIKNALRSPLRAGAIVIILAISIGLILSMLVARSSVEAKINTIKSTAGTAVIITPAGVNGFTGGGDPLTADSVAKITVTAHVSSISSTLSDQMTTSDTNLTSSLALGAFGRRQARSDGETSTINATATNTTRPTPAPRITVTGTTNPNSVSTNGGTLTIISGVTINGSSSDNVALVGTDLATKNNLITGSTFTAYGKIITVAGIYKTSNAFQDSGIVMPLATVQTLTSQVGDVTSISAIIDSSDNVGSVVNALKTTLGTTADITSQAEQAATSVSSLQSISNLALSGVIAATITAAVIVLLSMVMVVRERRREIGVIKAIGGTSFKVIVQFVSEALTLTILGAILGLTIGVVASGPLTSSLVSSQTTGTSTTQAGGFAGGARAAFNRGVGQIGTNLTQVTSSITPQVFASAVGITLLIAIIGSAVPAWFISRIRPGEVLRTE
jgi:putative ABC transport system permease protein